MRVYDRLFGSHSLVCGQVLLAPLDFGVRQQYLHARGTIRRLLELGVVPVVNENDAIADDEIRFGDNDRLAALVAHLVEADVLVLLTDTAGVLTADPRLDPSASLIEEIVSVDQSLEAVAGGAGSARGSGGMASKVAAAKMAAWSGVRAVIAAAGRSGVLGDAVAGAQGVGTVVLPRDRRLPARKLWIAFAVAPAGVVFVDEGAPACAARRGPLAVAGRRAAFGGVLRCGRRRRDRRPRRPGLRQGARARRCGCARGGGGPADGRAARRHPARGRPPRRPRRAALARFTVTPRRQA